jgi:hypothetical protein
MEEHTRSPTFFFLPALWLLMKNNVHLQHYTHTQPKRRDFLLRRFFGPSIVCPGVGFYTIAWLCCPSIIVASSSRFYLRTHNHTHSSAREANNNKEK